MKVILVFSCCLLLAAAELDTKAYKKWAVENRKAITDSMGAINYFAQGGGKAAEINIVPCTMTLRASGYDDKPRRMNGYVILNGVKFTDDKGRGFTIATVTDDCKLGEIRRYDTWGLSNQAGLMKTYLDSLPDNTRIVGITDDAYMKYLTPAKATLTQWGVSLVGSAFRTSLVFYAQKGKPTETVQKSTARYKGPAEMTYRTNVFSFEPETCRVTLSASGYDDKPRGRGYFLLNGEKVTDIKGRGITLVTITSDCKTGQITSFDTYGSTKATDDMKAYINGLPANTRLVGMSDDSFMRSLGAAKPVLTQMGVKLDGNGFRTSYVFVAIKGQPGAAVFDTAPRYKGPAELYVPDF